MNNPEKLTTQVTHDKENKNKQYNTEVWQNSKWCLSGMFTCIKDLISELTLLRDTRGFKLIVHEYKKLYPV